MMRHGRLVLSGVAAALLLVGAACGGDSGGSDVELSEAGLRGKNISATNGCAACHGGDGQGGAGPGWVGLAGSEVELADGTFVVADDEYLARAISDPDADLRAGYTLRMPANGLDDDEIADVIAYIHDLSPESRDD